VSENLVFQTIDIGHLLPTSLMDSRVQMYMTKGLWAYMEWYGNMVSCTNISYIIILGLMHHMLVFQNMHDFLGSDIPIICRL
ncbi:uncharacterized protein EV420DRAFT_1573219, partial [Desarmillaria tabescens]